MEIYYIFIIFISISICFCFYKKTNYKIVYKEGVELESINTEFDFETQSKQIDKELGI